MHSKATAATIMAAIALTASQAGASTLVLYEVDAQTGQRVGSSPYADQEITRMEEKGLVRAIRVPVDDCGELVEREIQVVAPQIVPPRGGVRVLTGRVVWRISTQIANGRLSFRNVITTEQGFDNGQGPLTDYRRSDVTVNSASTVPPESARPSIVQNYTTTRGSKTLIGFLRP